MSAIRASGARDAGRPPRRVWGALFAVAVFAAVPVACSSSSAGLQGEGGTCSLTSDCQEGLVCITQTDGTRKCSSDLAGIQSTEEAGTADATTPTKDGGKTGDGGKPPGDSGSPPPQDSGNPPPQDSGSPPQDSGSPPQDTGAPPPDAGGGGGGDAATD